MDLFDSNKKIKLHGGLGQVEENIYFYKVVMLEWKWKKD